MFRFLFLSFISLLVIGRPVIAQKSLVAEQQKIEFFAGIGTTSYFGEVGGPGDHATGLVASLDNLGWDPLQTRLGLTAGGRFGIKDNMALVTAVSPLWLSGSDKNSANENRGYSFNSWLINTSVLYEYYFNTKRIEFSPFLGTGVGVVLSQNKPNNPAAWDKPVFSSAFTFVIGGRLPSRSRFTQNIQIEFNYLFSDKIDGLVGRRNVGDTYYFVKYCINIEMDKTFIYNARGLIR